MNTMELIRTRRSIRTFDGRMISAEQREQLTEYIRTITNPYGIAVDFVLLDAKESRHPSCFLTGIFPRRCKDVMKQSEQHWKR